ncbi:MAG: c-type cytochrome biogenesis protein CcmI [Gammaproteobacteria bacterium]|nr:c-type cytochrome biogenesis protein CcmI [Gammaproteobacteria bacterium]
MFWISSFLLAGIAALFVVLPILRYRNDSRQIGMADRNAANLVIFKERLHELSRDYNEGLMDESQFQSIKAELERTLLTDVTDDIEPDQEASASQSDSGFLRSPVKFIPVVAMVLAIPLSYLLYDAWGFRDDLAVAGIFERSLTDGDNPEAIRDRIFELGAVIERDPENGWALYFIARHLVSLGQMEEAARFFERASTFIENPMDKAVVLGQYAQAQYIASGQQMTEQVSSIITQAQRLNPSEPAVLQLLGADAFVNQEYQAAVTYWQRLLNLNPSPEEAQFLRQVIAQAQEMTGSAAPGQTDSVAPGPVVEISLSVAPDIDLPAQTRVFVSAQSIDGGGPPLAAKLMALSDLPAVVTLTNADAVGPFNLTSADTIQVVATISVSGSADVQAGDYQVRSEPVLLEGSEAPYRLQLQIRDMLE